MFDGSFTMSFQTLNYQSQIFCHGNTHKTLNKARLNPVLAIPPSSVLFHTDESGNFPDSKKGSGSTNRDSAGSLLTESNTVGVIGGASVTSTLNFVKKLVQWSSKDGQNSLPFVLYSDPVLNKELLSHERKSFPSLSRQNEDYQLDHSVVVESLRNKRAFLEKSGARCIIMPCHISHSWYDEVSKGCSVPFLHMGECVAKELKEAKMKPLETGSPLRIGVLGTSATLTAGFYQEKLRDQGFEVVLPDKATMEHTVIPATDALNRNDMEGAQNLLRITLQVLLVRAVNTVILASDDMHDLLPQDDPLLKKCVNPMDALARATINWAQASEKDIMASTGVSGSSLPKGSLVKCPAKKTNRVASSNVTLPSKKLKNTQYSSVTSPSKKSKITQYSLTEPVKDLTYLVDPKQHFSAKVNYNFQADAPAILKECLDDKHIGLFRKTCFGYFLDMELIVGQPQLVHSLLIREIESENKNEMWFNVGGKKLKFGIEEFALVTGLKCHGDPSSASELNFSGDLMSRYFANSKTVHKMSLLEFVRARRWQSDEDAVNIAILFFIHWFILNRRKTSLSRLDFDVVESGLYKDYPWGRIAFDNLLRSVKGKLKQRLEDKPGKMHNFTYRLDGFPVGFQVWFYECCSKIEGLCATKVHDRIPRVLNWRASVRPTFKSLKKNIFDHDNLELKKLAATDAEIEQLKLNDLYASLKGNGKSHSFSSGKVHGHRSHVVEDLEELSDLNLVVVKLLELVADYKTFKRDVIEELKEQSSNIQKVFKKLDEIFVHVGLKKSTEGTIPSSTVGDVGLQKDHNKVENEDKVVDCAHDEVEGR